VFTRTLVVVVVGAVVSLAVFVHVI